MFSRAIEGRVPEALGDTPAVLIVGPRQGGKSTLVRTLLDVVLEDSRGGLYGVEIKATSTPRADDFRGLRVFAESVGSRFVRGVLLHDGTTTIPFAANLHALPISSLWTSPTA